MTLIRLVLAMVVALLVASGAWAQQLPTPGAVQRSIDRAETPSVRPETPPPETEEVERPKRAPVPEGGTRFLVKQFNFNGNSLYDDEQLRQALDGLVSELSSQYFIGYYPRESQRNGEFKRIRLEVGKQRLQARTRSGYYSSP